MQLHDALTHIKTVRMDIADLKGQMSDISKTQQDILAEFRSLHELLLIVPSLKDEIRRLRDGSRSESRPSTPKSKGGQSKTPAM